MADRRAEFLIMEASPEITTPSRLPLLRGVCMLQVRRIVGTIASYASLSILGRVVQMITAFRWHTTFGSARSRFSS